MTFEIQLYSIDGFYLLPPEQDQCPNCAAVHDDMQPHDANSFYYQFLFLNTHKRSPTWADAMAHCEPEVQEAWTKRLNSIGIDINSTDVKGGIKSKEELEERLAIAPDDNTPTE